MIGRIVVHTVYVIIIIMCYFNVSCIPVFSCIKNKLIILKINTKLLIVIIICRAADAMVTTLTVGVVRVQREIPHA